MQNKIRIALFLFILLIDFLFFHSLLAQSNLSGEEYIRQIEQHREEKNKEFKTETSPLTAEDKTNFQGLKYYVIDEQYQLKADFKKVKKAKTFQMKTTTERLPEYRKYGELSFELEGKKFKLNVYQNIELMRKPGFQDYLFIPFTDLTTAKETYGSGRYIDFKIPKSDTLILDFNLAYNPYCAYNYKYSCPIPPKENRLEIEIKAGEKIFKEKN